MAPKKDITASVVTNKDLETIVSKQDEDNKKLRPKTRSQKMPSFKPLDPKKMQVGQCAVCVRWED